jgi:HAE1 family hydrophobic/amphiphilic exporter-1
MAQLRVSAWAIKNPIPVAVIFAALTIAGLFTYGMLPIKQFPNVSLPAVSITIAQSGAAPSEMENQITRPIEDAIAGLTNVKNIRSTVVQGFSTTVVEFELGQDLQKITDDVRSKVDETRQILPREIESPIVQRVEMDSSPILSYAVSAPGMTQAELSWFIDDTIARTLQGEKGVAQISRVGGVNREINVILDPQRLRAYGLTANAVNDALGVFNVDVAGGRAQIGGREQTLRVLGAANTVDQIRNLMIPAEGRYVRLSDVAEIGDGAAEERGFARLNGRPAVGFQVMKTKEASDVQVEDRVSAAIDRLQAAQVKAGRDIKVYRIFATVDETRASYHATLIAMIEGMGLAALVVFAFLREWRSTAITAVAMPLSLIPTFAFMAVMGFSLNVVTLLALTLVIGILVDDAIVEIENIEKRIQAGARPYRAAMEGADSIGLAVVATTAAIVVVFTPVSFMPGVSGQFFKEFGLTVSVAVLFSLAVARFVTPLMAAYLLKPVSHAQPRKPFDGPYRKLLDWALDHRMVSVAVGGIVFVLSIMLTGLLPKGFQPASDFNFFYVKVQGPPGATRADMDRTIGEVTRLFLTRPETEMVFAQVGSTIESSGPGGGGGAADVRDGTVTVVLKDKRDLSVTEIKQQMRQDLRKIPDARVNFLGEFGSADVQTILTSENGTALEKAALQVEREMRDLDVVADPRPSSPPSGPEIVILPRKDEAARLGTTAQAIAAAARVATVGDIDANVPKFNDGGRRIPIRVRLSEAARTDLETIKALPVATATGDTVPLGAVADVVFQAGPAKINRFNRKREITIESDLDNGAQLGDAVVAIDNLPTMKALPEGVSPAAAGDQEAMAELFGALGMAIFAGISMIYGVLALLFRSFFKPATILSALPLAIGGAFLGLMIMNLSISLPSLIGILMLLGLAAKNSILLVDYAIELERSGASQRHALIEACRERARPIIMTTVAMAAGMLPTALGIGKGAEFRQPMAVAVIGGLITSTVLSLILVPVVYELIDDLENWLKPKLARFITPREAPEDKP